MKNFMVIVLALAFFSCEERPVKADNEFYGKTINEQIIGFEQWQKEAQEFAISNRWATKILEPLIGYFDIVYSKKNKANSDLKVILNYVFDVDKAFKELELHARKNNYNLREGEVQAGFYFPLQSGSVIQLWTIPADSVIANQKRGKTSMVLKYTDYTSTSSTVKDANGNIINIVKLNSISNATQVEPETEIFVFSEYGKKGSEIRVKKSMLKSSKIREFK